MSAARALAGLALSCLLAAGAARAQAPERRLGVAWNAAGSGSVRAMATSAPWAFTTPALFAGADVTLRYALGRVWAVSRGAGTLTEIDPVTWTPTRSYSVGSEPLDVAVVSRARAYVTRASATSLVRLDLASGATTAVVPLGAFADADGVPDLGMMAQDAGRLFVQIRRWNENGPFGQSPPAYLAVVDVASESLVDVDPVAPGTQAIQLQGTAPKHKMQVVSATRRLFVGATGGEFDAGGIEMIDLDSYDSLGFAVAEADGETGADLGAFVLVSPTRGFLTYTTDLTLSSHLTTFTTTGGADPGQLHVIVDYFVPALVHESRTDTVFMPDGSFSTPGVRAFDATTGAELSTTSTPTTGPPTDLALLCDCSDGGCSLEAQCPQVDGAGRFALPLALLLLGAALAAARLQPSSRVLGPGPPGPSRPPEPKWPLPGTKLNSTRIPSGSSNSTE